MKLKELTLHRNTSSTTTATSNYMIIRSSSSSSTSTSSSSPLTPTNQNSKNFLSLHPYKSTTHKYHHFLHIIQSILTFITSFTHNINIPIRPPPSANKTRHDNIMITCGRWLTVPHAAPRRKFMTGTLLGSKKGHVSFVVQEHPRSDPVLVLELATSTSALMREMASTGLVRIALECERRWSGGGGVVRLHEEKRWSMYCNGRMCGYAVGRACGEVDWEVLSVLQAVTVGAGVIPMKATGGGQVMYMRARFERVVGGRDSEAYYMMNPDKTGGPELSIFLLRI